MSLLLERVRNAIQLTEAVDYGNRKRQPELQAALRNKAKEHKALIVFHSNQSQHHYNRARYHDDAAHKAKENGMVELANAHDKEYYHHFNRAEHHVAQADKHEAEVNKTLDKLDKIRFGG